MFFAKNSDDAGAISEGFRTTTFPADKAPINGSKESPAVIDKKAQCHLINAVDHRLEFELYVSFTIQPKKK